MKMPCCDAQGSLAPTSVADRSTRKCRPAIAYIGRHRRRARTTLVASGGFAYVRTSEAPSRRIYWCRDETDHPCPSRRRGLDRRSVADAGRSSLLSVLTYHGVAVRSGHFIVPGLTQERARSIHLDTAFRAELSGRVYASRFIGKRRDRTPRSLSL